MMNRQCPDLYRSAKSIASAITPLPLLAAFCGALFCTAIVCTELQAQKTAPKLAAKSTNEAISQYGDGINFYNAAKWDLAADEFGAMLKDHPQDPLIPKTLHYLGICQLQLKRNDLAVATLGKLIRQFSKFESLDEAYFYFGFAHYRQGEAGKRSSLDSAAAAFAHLVKTYPKSKHVPQALYYQAEALSVSGKAKEAIAPYQRLLTDYPNSVLTAEAMYGLGWTYEDLRQFDAAGAIYDRFLKTFPKHELVPEIKMQKGETLLAKGLYKQAAPWFQAASNAEGFASAGHALFQLATCAFEQKDFQGASGLYLSVVKNYPKSPDATLAAMNGGKALFQLGKQAEARAALGPLVSAGGATAAEASHLIALCFIKEKNSSAALTLLAKQIPAATGGKWEVNLLMDRANATYEIADKRREAIDLYGEVAAKFADQPLAADALYMAGFAAFQVGEHELVLQLADQFKQTFPNHRLSGNVGYNAAEAQLMLEHFDKAEAQLRALITSRGEHPDLALWKKRLGYVLYFQEKSQAAINQLAPLLAEIKKPASVAEVQFWLGACYQQLKQYDKAQAAYAKSLEVAPAWPQADRVLMGLAECQARQKDLAGAITRVKKVIAEFPESSRLPAATYRLGTYLARIKQDSQAAESFKRVIATWPDGAYAPYAVRQLGLVQLRSKQYAEAVTSFSSLLEKHPNHNLADDALFDRGKAYQSLGKFQRAAADLTKFLVTNPAKTRKSNARLVLGICQDRLKKPAEAVKTFKTLLAEDSTYAATDGVLYELGWSLKGVNTKQSQAEAASTFTKVVTDFPESAYAQGSYAALGAYYYDNKQYAKAVASYNGAMKNLPKRAGGESMVHFLGQANYRLKVYDKAQQAFEKQIALWPTGPMLAEGLFMLGESLFKQRMYQPALAAFTQATAKKPADKQTQIVALLRTGQCAAQLKQWQASLPPLEALIENHPTSYYVADALYEVGWSKRNLADAAGAAEQAKQASALYVDAVKLFDASARKAGNRDVGARARFMMGEIYFLQKNHKEAIRNYLKVTLGFAKPDAKTETWKAKASYSLGRVYSVMKLLGKSRKWYQQTIEKYPKSPEAAEAKLRLADLPPK